MSGSDNVHEDIDYHFYTTTLSSVCDIWIGVYIIMPLWLMITSWLKSLSYYYTTATAAAGN